MIECLRCKKQYIGETKRMLRERFKEHRQATNNPNHSNATAAVPTHFNLPSHSSKDMRLIPLELQRPRNNGSRRKAREAYLIESQSEELYLQMALTDEMNVSHVVLFHFFYKYQLYRYVCIKEN